LLSSMYCSRVIVDNVENMCKRAFLLAIDRGPKNFRGV